MRKPNSEINVMDRKSGLVVKENIPHYIKVALKALYNSKAGRYISTGKKAKKILTKLSVDQGKKFDDPKSIGRCRGSAMFSPCLLFSVNNILCVPALSPALTLPLFLCCLILMMRRGDPQLYQNSQLGCGRDCKTH